MPQQKKETAVASGGTMVKASGAAVMGNFALQNVARGGGVGQTAKLTGSIFRKASPPVAAIANVVDATTLATSKQARKTASKNYEKSAKESAPLRTAKAAVNPVTTMYGAGANIARAISSTGDAKRSEQSMNAALKERDRKRSMQAQLRPNSQRAASKSKFRGLY